MVATYRMGSIELEITKKRSYYEASSSIIDFHSHYVGMSMSINLLPS